MKNILYCCFGISDYKYETIFSIFSLFDCIEEKANDFRILVITDDDSVLKKVFYNNKKITIEKISNEIKEEWLNNSDYIPRMKICAIEYGLKKFREDVLFIDCDTFCVDNISILFEQIKENNAVMYAKSNPEYKNVMVETYKDKEEYLNFYKYYLQYDSFYHYNSGCLGISYKNLGILKEVKELSDFFYNKFKIWISEEAAFSVILQQNNFNIILSNRYVYHYFYAKWFINILAIKYRELIGNEYKEYEKYYYIKSFTNEEIAIKEFPFILSYLSIKFEKQPILDLRNYLGNDCYAIDAAEDNINITKYYRKFR